MTNRRTTGTDPTLDAEDTIALDHIVRFVERLIAAHEPYGIAPERLIDRLFEGLVTSHPVG